jgi:endonuclease/exonuclease/phosphatase (EEP) superfamily protein YafD
VGTHVHRPTRNPYIHELQMKRLASIVGAVTGPVVLAGDFNAVPWSASFRRLRAHTGLKPHAQMMPTWPALPVSLPQFALDHVLLSSDLDVQGARLGSAVGSDHYPVIVDLAPFQLVSTPPRGPQKRILHAAAPTHLLPEIIANFGREHHTP